MLKLPTMTCWPPRPRTTIVVKLASSGGIDEQERVVNAQGLLGVDHPRLVAGPADEQVRLGAGRLDALDDLDRPHDARHEPAPDLLDRPVPIDLQRLNHLRATRFRLLIPTPTMVRRGS